MTKIIETYSISKRYVMGEEVIDALKDVTISVNKGEYVAFMGPSGSGKSTLLRTLNRMYSLYPGQRAEGEINLYGENILNPKLDLNLLRSKIGMIFQKPTPFPMSVYDNIAFGVRLYENLNKKIIAPSIWFGSRYSHWNLSDLYCENFIKI